MICRYHAMEKITSRGIALVEIASSIFFISVIFFLLTELYQTKLLLIDNPDRSVESVVKFLRHEIKLAEQLWVDHNGNLHVQDQQSQLRYRWMAVADRYFLIREIWETDKWVKRPNVLLPAFSINAVANVSFVQIEEKGVGIQIQEDNHVWMINEGD